MTDQERAEQVKRQDIELQRQRAIAAKRERAAGRKRGHQPATSELPLFNRQPELVKVKP